MAFCQTERKTPLATLVFVEVILSQRRDWELDVALSFLAALNTPIHVDSIQCSSVFPLCGGEGGFFLWRETRS